MTTPSHSYSNITGRQAFIGRLDADVCRDLVVEGVRSKGTWKKTLQESVNEDMKQVRLRRCDAQDRTVCKNGVFGKRLNSASADKGTLK